MSQRQLPFDTLYVGLQLILSGDQKTYATKQNVKPGRLIIGDIEYTLPAFVRSASSYDCMRPNPGLKDRQVTCGEESCKRECNRRKCPESNRENSGFIKKERLAHQLRTVPRASAERKLTTKPMQARHPFRARPNNACHRFKR